jgi:hypothetical protein
LAGGLPPLLLIEVYVVPHDGADCVGQVERTADELTALAWRLHDLGVVSVDRPWAASRRRACEGACRRNGQP